MKKFITILALALSMGLIAQSPVNKMKDDPQGRVEFERLRLRDPLTGDIPPKIRLLELEFLASSMALRRDQTATNGEWVNRGPYNVGGRTRALAVDVNDESVILAGGVSGGVWKSVNQGISWFKTTSPEYLQSVTAIAQDKRSGHTNVWYYVTGEFFGNSANGWGAPYTGGGIFKSIDNGNSWFLLESTYDGSVFNVSDFDYNHEISVNPVNGDVYVANRGGIYRSQDGGVVWEKVLSHPGSGWTDVEIANNGTIYAAIDQSGIFKSRFGNNETWDLISSASGMTNASGARKELALAPSNQNILYVLMESSSGTAGHQLWKYDAASLTWINRSHNLPMLGGQTGDFDSQGGYDLLIEVSPVDENFLIIGGINLFRSADAFATSINEPSVNNSNWIGGYTRQNNSYGLYPNHHPDQHAFVFLSGTKALSGNDGGVQLTHDFTSQSVVWEWLNNGYLTTQSYAVSVGPENQIMSGFQDNSTWLTTSSESNVMWSDQFGGDGGYNAFNSTALTRYLSSQYGNIYRVRYADPNSENAISFTYFTPSNYQSAIFIPPFYIDPTNDDLFYLGGASNFFINRSSETGSSTSGWIIPQVGNVGFISQIGVTNFNQVVIGTHVGELFKIYDPGGTPIVQNITGSNFPNAYVSGISINAFDASEILISFSNYNVLSLFHTVDGGITWQDVGGNLEEFANGTGNGPSVRSVAISGSGDKYFAATSAGLYSTDLLEGKMTIWTQEDPSGIGNAVVEHLVSRSDGFLVAGTHANGVYSSKVEVQLNNTDLAMLSIMSPVTSVLSNAEQVTVRYANIGQDNQSQYSLALYLNDNLVSLESVQTPISFQESLEYTFSHTLDLSEPGKEHVIKVEILLPGDQNFSNNTLTKSVISILPISTFPYEEDFETTDHLWTSTGVWELGAPTKSKISSASGGTKAWVTNLNGNYPNQARAVLLSPFFDFSEFEHPAISFDINYAFEIGWDGVALGYRSNSSDAFTILFNASNFRNWYTGQANVFGHEAWQGSTNGSYLTALADLSVLSGLSNIQFGFIFMSDELENDEGFAMDRFKIFDGTIPFGLTLSNSSISEMQPEGSPIGTFVTEDFDNDNYTYVLIANDDSESFTINANELRSNKVFDFEMKSSYTIHVKTMDASGNDLSKIFSISILNDESDDPLSVNPLERNGVRIFPNPVKNRLNLDMFNDYFGEVSITVHSIDGKQLIERNEIKTGYALKGLLDINSLPNGIFIVKLIMGEEVLVGKVLKE